MTTSPLNERGATVWDAAPRCTFHVRTQVSTNPVGYRYEPIHVVTGAQDNGALRMPTPPAVGDLIWLVDEAGKHTGTHRVIERSWGPPNRGSVDWPWDAAHPKVGPLLQLILVPDDGPFRNEVTDAETEIQ